MMVRMFSLGHSAGHSTSRFTIVGAANIDVPGQAPKQRENLLRLEAAGFRHDVDAAAHHSGHHVEAGAVAHRRRVQQRIAGRQRVDLGGIGLARGGQHLVRQHRALRPAGGARGVEQPGEIVAAALNHGDRIGGEQHFIVRAADADQPLKTFRRMRGKLAVEPVGNETHPRAGLFEDVAQLGAVQLGVGRHRGQARMPDRVQHFDIIRAVPGDDGDAITGVETERAERTGEPRHPARRVAVAAQHPRAKPKRGAAWIVPARAFQKEREVQWAARPR